MQEAQIGISPPGVLVLTDVFYPGWAAYIDGGATGVYRSNGLVRVAVVEKGEHTVVFVYFPCSFALGLAIAFLAALVSSALLLKKGRQ